MSCRHHPVIIPTTNVYVIATLGLWLHFTVLTDSHDRCMIVPRLRLLHATDLGLVVQLADL